MQMFIINKNNTLQTDNSMEAYSFFRFSVQDGRIGEGRARERRRRRGRQRGREAFLRSFATRS